MGVRVPPLAPEDQRTQGWSLAPQDAIYCMRLAQNAVHAALAGKTAMLVGRWHGHFVHIPIPLAIQARKNIDPQSSLWLSVLQSTGQPATMA